ncbi:MAG: hypothetical protein GWN16_13805, partial [Calditrichae bacterium]|nr:hypothetical protein [Calditrichia bacterium]
MGKGQKMKKLLLILMVIVIAVAAVVLYFYRQMIYVPDWYEQGDYQTVEEMVTSPEKAAKQVAEELENRG